MILAAVGRVRPAGGDVRVDRVRRDDLCRRHDVKAQRGERIAHFEQGVVHGAVAEHGHEHGRGVRPAQGTHALKTRPGHAPTIDREEHEQAVVGENVFASACTVMSVQASAAFRFSAKSSATCCVPPVGLKKYRCRLRGCIAWPPNFRLPIL